MSFELPVIWRSSFASTSSGSHIRSVLSRAVEKMRETLVSGLNCTFVSGDELPEKVHRHPIGNFMKPPKTGCFCHRTALWDSKDSLKTGVLSSNPMGWLWKKLIKVHRSIRSISSQYHRLTLWQFARRPERTGRVLDNQNDRSILILFPHLQHPKQ